MKDKIVQMLGAGVRPTAVAAATGVSESYVSQVASECAEQIGAARAVRTTEHIEHDSTLDTLEDRSLQKVGRLLDTVSDPMKALAVFKVLNAAKRRSETISGDTAPMQVVEIELPMMAQVAIKVSSNNQVIEVAGRSMLTMQAKNVEALLTRREEEKRKTIELIEVDLVSSVPTLLESL